MPADTVFKLVNSLALASWLALAVFPHHRAIRGVIRWGVVLGLSLLYAVLVAVYFFRVEGGGFFSLAAVQRLFDEPTVALAGWVHYLAFDLLIGLMIAQQAERMALSRTILIPVLLTTFMFGPIGWLLFQAVLATHSAVHRHAESGAIAGVPR